MDGIDYSRPLDGAADGPPLRIVETEIDLYWDIALEIYLTIEEANNRGRACSLILPVGPVFQYRRLVGLLERQPLDLSGVHLFFMDEYLVDRDTRIGETDPLSFRGFIRRELVEPLHGTLPESAVAFPDPARTSAYDERIASLGGVDLCVAGVGINGHLAFNEPPEAEEEIDNEAFSRLPTRVVELTRETRTINSNTALRGAYERVPRLAVTVGMRQILESRRIRIYLNRPWQSAVLRKLLFGEVTCRFPASLVRDHRDVAVVATREVAEQPDFRLR